MIVLFDGECNLCNRSVNFIIRHDPEENFCFASLQSEVAKKLVPELSTDLNTIVLVKNDAVFTKSLAALMILEELDHPLRFFHHLKWLPRVLRDPFYDFISRNRKRLFPKPMQCSADQLAQRKKVFID